MRFIVDRETGKTLEELMEEQKDVSLLQFALEVRDEDGNVLPIQKGEIEDHVEQVVKSVKRWGEPVIKVTHFP